jgi:hypothetical protein
VDRRDRRIGDEAAQDFPADQAGGAGERYEAGHGKRRAIKTAVVIVSLEA